jgi:integrase
MRSRRGRGEGSVRKRSDGRWEATISLGFGPDSKRRRRYFYGGTKAQVTAQLRAWTPNGDLPKNRQTVEEFLQLWLDRVRIENRVNTYKLRAGTVRNHIVPHLGPLRLGSLTAGHGYGWIQKLQSLGIGARSTQVALVTMKRALNVAVQDGLLKANPFAQMKKPVAPRPRPHILSYDNARQLLEAARSRPYFELYCLALTTGLRQGELFGLRWADVDLDNGTLHVKGAINQDLDGALVLTDPKTESSRRIVELPPSVVSVLKALKQKHLGQAESWIFPNRAGGPLQKSDFIRRNFKPLLKDAGLPDMTFHSLRHAANSKLLDQGVSIKVVQERLGHTTARMTLDTYGHVLPGQQREAAEKIDALFGDVIVGGQLAVNVPKTMQCSATAKAPQTLTGPCKTLGGDEETRTPDPLHAKQVLYQLSYIPRDEGDYSGS